MRRLGEAFPERKVEVVRIAALANDAPELVLWRQLAAYGELRKQRIATLPAHKAALAKLAFVGLQQRLLSSIAAFLRTLKAHRKTLQRLIDGEVTQGGSAAAEGFVDGSTTDKSEDLGLEDESAEAALEANKRRPRRPHLSSVPINASPSDLRKELAAVDEMLAFASTPSSSPTRGCIG